MVRVIQDAWSRFVVRYGVETDGRDGDWTADNNNSALFVPFDHPDVRVIIDTMFLEGVLQPIAVHVRPADLPDWIRVGLIDDPQALSRLVSEGATRIAADMPLIDAPYRDWVEAARRLAELINRFNELKAEDAAGLQDQVRTLQLNADARLKEWVFRHFTDLPSLPVAKAPVMVHHVPRYGHLDFYEFSAPHLGATGLKVAGDH
jgi:hypothetical protein